MDAVTRVATALLALVATLGSPAVAAADTAPAPCVAAGVVAIVPPGAAAPTTLGPAVAASATEGTPTGPFHDSQYSVDLTNAAAGAAGCVGGGAPGGTHATAAAWSVLGGAVRGSALDADLVPAGGDGSGWHLRTTLQGLSVAGAPTDPVPGATVAVADWGTLAIDAQVDLPRLAPLRYWAAALELKLVKPHGGLPAGTLVLVGYAAANHAPAAPPEPAPTTTVAPTTTTAPPAATTTAPAATTTRTTTALPPKKASKPRAKHRAKAKPKHEKKRHVRPRRKKRLTGQPLTVTPPLRVADDVFPVSGGADWGDTYGADRSDVPGGWHHGDDLFAPLGTPVVAVADGTVFAVGWNRVGGWRLWLRDAAGNSYYYAHLSGYTRLAKDDGHVRRGDVLGFVGNTGDAFTTDPHLHFEVHPNGTLYLGYDGAVDPTSYLRAWPLAHDVHVLPPVRLPDGAPAGFGSATDFRKLLAVHPLPAKPRPPKKAKEAPTRASDRPQRVAAGGTRRATATAGGDGALPIVFAILLLAGGLGAIAHTHRAGRT
jgi:murein DD-endopeptidase MepM/ murein hydrolase activator NlpD